MLAILSRVLVAATARAEQHFALRLAQRSALGRGPSTSSLDVVDHGIGSAKSSSSTDLIAAARDTQTRAHPPFDVVVDGARGALFVLQSFLSFMLMLAVMTFNGQS